MSRGAERVVTVSVTETPRFIVVIPVADRPLQVQDCLSSLAELMRLFPDSCPVSVLIADDSLTVANQTQHRALAAAFTAEGLPCAYFGLTEQQAQIDGFSMDAHLAASVGERATAHKGASRMRNLAYLHVAEMADVDTRVLFIDSDQTFLPELDFFGGLQRAFSETDAWVLTGKVVGDPPVSPAVMAGTFLDDVVVFLTQMRALDPTAPCTFHGPAVSAEDAAYHDMAGLFGFSAQAAFRYPCDMAGAHDHAATLAHFSAQLRRFFYGEHPTRKSYYQPLPNGALGLTPARTLYTGNYCLRPEALRYFIPFSDLRLRMAGPTLGRILKMELGARFCTANLPMQHHRTLEATGASEFRPGVLASEQRIDLSDEYERQFYGDVMLFTVEKGAVFDAEMAIFYDATHAEITARYAAMRAQTEARLRALRTLIDAGWPAQVTAELEIFYANMVANFVEAAAGPVRVIANAAARRREILAALASYAGDRAAWDALLSRMPHHVLA